MLENKAKVISLVPSWTETLLSAGIDVVGRTRFCIHPSDKITQVPSVGGTKNIKIEDIMRLQPDFVVMDKEENRLEMAEQLQREGIQLVVSHVSSIRSAAEFLNHIGVLLKNTRLQEYSDRYMKFVGPAHRSVSRKKFWTQICIRQNSEPDWDNMEYVIWKNPLMCIGRETFIEDVFSLIDVSFGRTGKYPVVSEDELKLRYALFSSEPYPFTREFDAWTEKGFRGALVDGEQVSWYGIRNLIFLENSL